jgi:hypothetical protein
MAINTDDPCGPDHRFLVNVLVAVEEQAWVLLPDVTCQSLEATVGLVLLVVDVARAVVADEHIHSREVFQ